MAVGLEWFVYVVTLPLTRFRGWWGFYLIGGPHLATYERHSNHSRDAIPLLGITHPNSSP